MARSARPDQLFGRAPTSDRSCQFDGAATVGGGGCAQRASSPIKSDSAVYTTLLTLMIPAVRLICSIRAACYLAKINVKHKLHGIIVREIPKRG